MTVSVIVPVYKAEDWLQQCLDSIHAQTYKDIELIVVDDAQGTGAAAARNRGLEKATGDLIAFCDADDYMEPQAIEKMVEAIKDVDMVCGSFRKFGDFEATVTHPTTTLTTFQVAKYVMGNLRNPRQNQMLSGCWAKLFWRSLVGRFPLLTTAEDMAFTYNCLMRCERIRFIENIVYNNRKRQGSLTTTFDIANKQGLFGFLEGLKCVKAFLDDHDFILGINSALDNSKCYHSMLYMMRICEAKGWTMQQTFRELYP